MQVVLVLLHKRIVPYETHKIKKYGRVENFRKLMFNV